MNAVEHILDMLRDVNKNYSYIDYINALNNKSLEYVGHGKTRITFLTPLKGCVLKVPYNIDGWLANISEHYIYRNRTKEIFAPCRLICNVFLIMKKCNIIYETSVDNNINNKDIIHVDLKNTFDKTVLEFEQSCVSQGIHIDCHQIGYYKNNFVLYDYPDDNYIIDVLSGNKPFPKIMELKH